MAFSSVIATTLRRSWVMGFSMKRLTSAAAVLAVIILPIAAYADAPSHTARSGQQRIQGVIRSIDGTDAFTVRVAPGLVDNVTMRQDTIVAPTGLFLKAGMRVAIAGRADGDTFEADRIVGSPLYQSTSDKHATLARPTLWPELIPNGTFQTNGPSAEGGG